MAVPLFDTAHAARAAARASSTRARRGGPRRRALHPRPGGRGLRGGVRRLARRRGTRSASPTAPRRSRSRCARSASGPATRSSSRRSPSTPAPRRSRRPARRPVFCDVDPRDVLRDAETVQAALTPRTKAVIAVHLFGNVAPVARDRGARRAGRRGRRAGGGHASAPDGAAGRARHARDVLVLSLEEPRRASATAARSRPTTTRSPSACARCASTARATRSRYEEVGYNSRLDELQAAVLRVLLPHLDALGGRPPRRPARRYEEAGLGELVALPQPAAGARARLAPLRRAPRARRRAARGARASAASARAPTTARRSTASRRWRATAPAPSCPAPTRRARTHLALPISAAITREQVDEVTPRSRRSRDARLGRPHEQPARARACGPVIERAARARRTRCEVTARDFAQTLGAVRALRDRRTTAIGRHRGGRARRQGARARDRSRGAARAGRAGARFDLALGHGSNDVTVAARAAADPAARRCSTTSGRRSSTRSTAAWRRRSSCPTRSRPSASTATARRGKLRALPGAQGGVLPRRLRARRRRARRARRSTRRSRSPSCARRPRSRSTTASRTTLFAGVLDAAARRGAGGRAAAHAASSAPSSRRPAASSSPSARSTRSR